MHFFFFLLYLTRGMRLGESFRMSDTSECSLVVVAVFFFFVPVQGEQIPSEKRCFNLPSVLHIHVLLCSTVTLLGLCVFFFLYFGTILVFSFVSVYVVVSDLLCLSFFFLCVCVFVGLSFPSFLFFFLLSMHVSSTLVVTVQAVVDDGLFFSLCTHQRVLFCTVSHTHTHMQDFFFSSLLYSLGFSFWLGD